MKFRKVKVSPDKRNSYEILIGPGVLNRIAVDLAEAKIAHWYALITDSNVAEIYGKALFKELESALGNAKMIVFPAGEKNKNRKNKALIEDRMLDFGFGRDCAIIALGGGVVGDLAGFVAATYMRGIPCIQVPTTLVACVDSSVGGKTAVDTSHGKNLIGSFHQPQRVYADIDALKTLEPKHISEGLAEVIKYGVIKSSGFFSYLEKNIEKIFKLDDTALLDITEISCQIKAEVVREDEREQNLRKILNFGHTVGHAIEQLSKYTVSHGEAISVGMVIEGEIALERTEWTKEDQQRLVQLLKKARLPVEMPYEVDVEEIIEIMKIDKKARRGKIEISLPVSIGKMREIEGSYGIRVDEQAIKAAFKSLATR